MILKAQIKYLKSIPANAEKIKYHLKYLLKLTSLLKYRLQRQTTDIFSNVSVQIFVSFVFALYVVNFVVNALATLFREIHAGDSLLSPTLSRELLSIIVQTTYPFFAAGMSGILAIMLFILLVSYLFTRLILAPIKEASSKQKLFAANASHELRTPLSTLKTLTDVARMRSAHLSKEDIEAFARNVGEEVDNMSHIIEFFVRFSSLEEKGSNLHMSSVRLSQLAESVRHALEHIAKIHRVEVVIDKDMPGVVRGNFTALEELLINLTKNAITFSPPNSIVCISSKLNKFKNVELSVADHGSGISADDLPHIFEPFYHSGKKKNGTRSGLGLTLVKQIAKLHHAAIKIDTKVSAGTTFTIEFPLSFENDALHRIFTRGEIIYK